MDKMICGHERRVLVWALTDAKRRSAGSVATLKTLRLKNNYQQAIVDVNDPAKLAAMMVEEGRRLGLDVGAFDAFGGAEMQIWPRPRDKTICVDGNKDSSRLCVMTMPQARTILLQWLQLPDGAREEAEHALRGDT